MKSLKTIIIAALITTAAAPVQAGFVETMQNLNRRVCHAVFTITPQDALLALGGVTIGILGAKAIDKKLAARKSAQPAPAKKQVRFQDADTTESDTKPTTTTWGQSFRNARRWTKIALNEARRRINKYVVIGGAAVLGTGYGLYKYFSKK